MSKVSKKIVEDGLKHAKGASCYGVPLEEMTRKELIAVAALGWASYTQAITVLQKAANNIEKGIETDAKPKADNAGAPAVCMGVEEK